MKVVALCNKLSRSRGSRLNELDSDLDNPVAPGTPPLQRSIVANMITGKQVLEVRPNSSFGQTNGLHLNFRVFKVQFFVRLLFRSHFKFACFVAGFLSLLCRYVHFTA